MSYRYAVPKLTVVIHCIFFTKRALMIVVNKHYFVHSELFCKALNLVKVPSIHLLSAIFVTHF